MIQRHKEARVRAIQTVCNNKTVVYLTDKFEIIQPHRFTGGYMEKFVYSKGKVKIYDNEGKEIKEPKEEKPETKSKAKTSRKLSDAPDEKLGRDF
jgi:hypothetical protein